MAHTKTHFDCEFFFTSKEFNLFKKIFRLINDFLCHFIIIPEMNDAEILNSFASGHFESPVDTSTIRCGWQINPIFLFS